eukprot:4768507-Pyramimonas_sp.AAC.1
MRVDAPDRGVLVVASRLPLWRGGHASAEFRLGGFLQRGRVGLHHPGCLPMGARGHLGGGRPRRRMVRCAAGRLRRGHPRVPARRRGGPADVGDPQCAGGPEVLGSQMVQQACILVRQGWQRYNADHAPLVSACHAQRVPGPHCQGGRSRRGERGARPRRGRARSWSRERRSGHTQP